MLLLFVREGKEVCLQILSSWFFYSWLLELTVDCLMKNLNASKPSEHPPTGGKIKTFWVRTLAAKAEPLDGI